MTTLKSAAMLPPLIGGGGGGPDGGKRRRRRPPPAAAGPKYVVCEADHRWAILGWLAMIKVHGVISAGQYPGT